MQKSVRDVFSSSSPKTAILRIQRFRRRTEVRFFAPNILSTAPKFKSHGRKQENFFKSKKFFFSFFSFLVAKKKGDNVKSDFIGRGEKLIKLKI